MQDAFESAGVSDTEASAMGANLDDAYNAVDNGDFEAADAALSKLEQQLQDVSDVAEPATAANLGESLDKARSVVAEAKGGGVDKPGNGADAGAPEPSAPKDLKDLSDDELGQRADAVNKKMDEAKSAAELKEAATEARALGDEYKRRREALPKKIKDAPAAPGKGADAAGNPAPDNVDLTRPGDGSSADASDALGELESTLQDAFDSPGVDADTASTVGGLLDGAHSDVDNGDFDAADEKMSEIESILHDAADSGALDENTAGKVGEALDKARNAVDAGKSGNAPDTSSDAAAPTPAPASPAPAAPDTAPAGGGSVQQQNVNKVADTASVMEQTLQDVFEGAGLDDNVAKEVGIALDDLRDQIDQLQEDINNGSYNAQILAEVQRQLQGFESMLMGIADGPGLSDSQANQIGQVLDDMFAQIGDLATSLQGDSNPPPFAARRYVRQWLGRKGIRLDGRSSLI